MAKKNKAHEPVLLDAAEASDDETKPLYSSSSQGLSYAPNVAYIRKPPKDYQAGALLSAIFCFLPLGLFALYYSFKVNKLYQKGHLSSSNKASERTRFLINLTLLLGSLLWFGGIVGVILFANRFH